LLSRFCRAIREGWGIYKFDNEWLDFAEIEPFVVDFAFKK
jgi:hypothetical protein